MKRIILASCATAFALVSGSALSDPAEYPAAMSPVIQSGGKVLNTFDAGGGMTGWAVAAKGKEHILYTSEDGSRLLVGVLMNADGKNLTAEHRDLHIPAPDYQSKWSELQDAAWIADGPSESDNFLYVFLEPNCSYCHLVWKALQPYMTAGLQVRWVPVAFLSDNSMGKAAALLEAEDPTAAVNAHEQRFQNGGIDGLTAPAPQTLAKLDANSVLMQSLGIRGTPAIVHRDGQGKVRVSRGMPKLTDLATMAKLPFIPTTDPTLMRFK